MIFQCQLDSVPLLKIIKAIESVKADFKPELVYTHGDRPKY